MRTLKGLSLMIGLSLGGTVSCSPEQEVAPRVVLPAGSVNTGDQARRAFIPVAGGTDTVKGVVPDMPFPLRGQYSPGESDPISKENVQGYRISCVTAVNMASEAEARGICPATCSAAGQTVWTGYWRTSQTTRSGVCECISAAAGGGGGASNFNNLSPNQGEGGAGGNMASFPAFGRGGGKKNKSVASGMGTDWNSAATATATSGNNSATATAGGGKASTTTTTGGNSTTRSTDD